MNSSSMVAGAVRELFAQYVMSECDDAALVLNGDGRIVLANHAATDELGDEQRDLIGNDLRSLVHPDDLDRVVERVGATAVRVVSRDGWIRSDITMFCTDGGPLGRITLLIVRPAGSTRRRSSEVVSVLRASGSSRPLDTHRASVG